MNSSAEAPWPTGPTAAGPLAGARILDLSRILAGPFATMNLADLGADVVKVESPSRGDETRYWGPPFADDGTATYFLAVNHNKRSVALDLAHPDGRAVAQDLAVQADVVIDNFLPGRLAKFGLDRASLLARNPELVTATISGFGTDNAYAGRPGFDFLAQAMGGMMSITGAPGGEPTRVGVAVSDLFAGLYAALGIVSALREREHTGVGRHLEISLLDTQVAMLANIGSGWLNGGTAPRRFGDQHPSIAPYETLATRDHRMAVAVGTDRQFGLFVTAIGRPEMATDTRFATNPSRVAHRAALVAALEEALAARGRDEWLVDLVAAGVPVAPVNSVPEVFADPVISERMVVDVDGVPQIRSPLRVDAEPLPIHTAPRGLGADTDDVLAQMGHSAASIAAMRAGGVIG